MRRGSEAVPSGRAESTRGPRVSIRIESNETTWVCVCKVVIFPLIAPFDVLCGRVRAYRRDAGCGGGEIGACIGPIP